MGEAKRRKQLDQDFGKNKYKIWIDKSEKSGNFLVMVDDLIFDSACEKKDAEKIAELLKRTIKDKPFPRRMDLMDLKKWSLENTHHFPAFDKFILKNGQLERKTMHISESIKLQMDFVKPLVKKIVYRRSVKIYAV